MKYLAMAALLLTQTATLADATDVVSHAAAGSVEQTVERLASSVEEAGATVFAVVDHGGGAMSVGADVGESQLVIFGNPALGTPAIADNRLAALYLPLKMLVFEDAQGQVQVAYESPEHSLGDLDGIGEDAAYLTKMQTALDGFARTAASQ